MSLTRRILFSALPALALAGAFPARAEGLGSPSGKPILRISGKITTFNQGSEALFDLAMLEALGSETMRTRTPWYDQAVVFQGVLMRKLLEVVGAYGDSLMVIALNDYACQIPAGDFTRFPVLLAYKRNGQPMPISDKGPLFIVYPYDSDPELQSQKYYSRSPWQVAKIQVI